MDITLLGSGPFADAFATRLAAAGHRLVPATQRSVVLLASADASEALGHLGALEERVVIDASTPFSADRSGLSIGHSSSGAEEIIRALPRVTLVKAFNTLTAGDLAAPLEPVAAPITVYVASDSERARQTAIALAHSLGFETRDAGPLRHARYLEPLAALNHYLAQRETSDPALAAQAASFTDLPEVDMHTPASVLFVSHGAPTFAVEPGLAGARLAELGQRLPRPRAIVVLSPHWMTRGGIAITAASQLETIHDFGGFPAALYALRYPAPGAPGLATQIAERLQAAGWNTQLDAARGLDHGAWVPLLHLFPQADIPVVQVSLPFPIDPHSALRLGQALAGLRDEGVLIVASGSLTHNLYEFRGSVGAPEAYVQRFAEWTAEALRRGDAEALLDYREQAPEAARAHPSDEHLLPLFIALGASGQPWDVEVIDGGIVHGVLAMDSYLFGADARPNHAQEHHA